MERLLENSTNTATQHELIDTSQQAKKRRNKVTYATALFQRCVPTVKDNFVLPSGHAQRRINVDARTLFRSCVPAGNHIVIYKS